MHSGLTDGPAHRDAFVGAQIVQDDDGGRSQRGENDAPLPSNTLGAVMH